MVCRIVSEKKLSGSVHKRSVKTSRVEADGDTQAHDPEAGEVY